MKMDINFTSMLTPCNPNQEIRHIMHFGKQIPLDEPTLAENVRCRTCNGNTGFYIPHLATWSCLNTTCIQVNAGKEDRKKSNNEVVVIRKSYLDDCKQKEEYLSYFRQYALNPLGFMILAGFNGTGKTYAAKAIYDDFICDLDDKKFINQVELNLLWTDNLQKYNSTSELLKQFCNYKLLVIDDLGTRTPTESFMDFLYALADKRYQEKRGTIITTNMTYKQLREKFGDAFASRVASGKNIRLEGEDRRIEYL